MNIDTTYFYAFIVINIIITFFVLKRSKKIGCIAFGYIGLVLFIINLFTVFSWLSFYSTIEETYGVLTSGKNYTATVINYTSKEVYNSENRQYRTMYTPIVEFTTFQGDNITRSLDFSTSGLEIGDTYWVNYNTATGKVTTLGFTITIKVVGTFLFCFIFMILFIGEILYLFNLRMDRYFSFLKGAGLYFFLPLIMIGFDALLIYALFYGNAVPLWVSLLLVFFIIMLTLAIMGYFKMMFSKEK